jgi:hypothetical protein
MGIQTLGEIADELRLRIAGRGKGEGIETGGLVVYGVIPDAHIASVRGSPGLVRPRFQNPQKPSVIKGNGDEFVVREDAARNELEYAMLGDLGRSDVTGKTINCSSQARLVFSEQPPLFPAALSRVVITFGLHVFKQMLITSRGFGFQI